MSKCKDWYVLHMYGVSMDVTQPLISKMKKAIKFILLGDTIFKQKLNGLKNKYWNWWDIIVIQPFFHPNMDMDSDLYMLEFDVGELTTCTDVSIKDGKEVSTCIRPEDQARRLAEKLAYRIWGLLKRKHNVLVSIGYFTKSKERIGTPEWPDVINQINYQRVNVALEKGQKRG